ncbi:hypothetical protein P7C70_g4905, partial [Phenoliferia sp. Uapishka_3]
MLLNSQKEVLGLWRLCLLVYQEFRNIYAWHGFVWCWGKRPERSAGPLTEPQCERAINPPTLQIHDQLALQQQQLELRFNPVLAAIQELTRGMQMLQQAREPGTRPPPPQVASPPAQAAPPAPPAPRPETSEERFACSQQLRTPAFREGAAPQEQNFSNEREFPYARNQPRQSLRFADEEFPLAQAPAFIEKMDIFISSYNIPEEILLPKLPQCLKDTAGKWFRVRIQEPNKPNCWEVWKAEIRDRFMTTSWLRKQQSKLRSMRYTGQNPLDWIEEFFFAAKAILPGVSQDSRRMELVTRVPFDIAMNLRNVPKDLPMSQFQKEFEDIASLWILKQGTSDSTSKEQRRPAYSPRDSRSAPVGLSPRPAPGLAPIPAAPGACHNCGETGHWARECTKPRAQGAIGPHPAVKPEAPEEPADERHEDEAPSSAEEYWEYDYDENRFLLQALELSDEDEEDVPCLNSDSSSLSSNEEAFEKESATGACTPKFVARKLKPKLSTQAPLICFMENVTIKQSEYHPNHAINWLYHDGFMRFAHKDYEPDANLWPYVDSAFPQEPDTKNGDSKETFFLDSSEEVESAKVSAGDDPNNEDRTTLPEPEPETPEDDNAYDKLVQWSIQRLAPPEALDNPESFLWARHSPRFVPSDVEIFTNSPGLRATDVRSESTYGTAQREYPRLTFLFLAT